MNILKTAIGALMRHEPAAPAARPRIALPADADITYAIGDVHGRLDLLLALERLLEQDAARFLGTKRLILLGDYIDRGPQSAAVLDHLIQSHHKPPFERFYLVGNHELMMLDAFGRRQSADRWLALGGRQTLASYGLTPQLTSASLIQSALDRVPQAHLDFLREMPILVQTPSYLFVHAGAVATRPLDEHSDAELTEMRFSDAPAATAKQIVVHGHSIVRNVEVGPNRIALDLGAFATGRLAAVKLVQGEEPVIFST